MRIISGRARGTKLNTLEGLSTRPTLDRVKESLFNIINAELQDSTILDLFAGSGALGLEAISRGVKEATLCDKSAEAIKIIKQNVEKTHCSSQVKIYNMDFKECLNKIKDTYFDIIFLDPPYDTDFSIKALELILEYDMIKKTSTIIIETDDKQRILEEIKNIKINVKDIRKYGRANLIFLKL